MIVKPLPDNAIRIFGRLLCVLFFSWVFGVDLECLLDLLCLGLLLFSMISATVLVVVDESIMAGIQLTRTKQC